MREHQEVFQASENQLFLGRFWQTKHRSKAQAFSFAVHWFPRRLIKTPRRRRLLRGPRSIVPCWSTVLYVLLRSGFDMAAIFFLTSLCPLYLYRGLYGRPSPFSHDRSLRCALRRSHLKPTQELQVVVQTVRNRRSAFGAHAFNARDRDNVRAHAEQRHMHANRPDLYDAHGRSRIPPCPDVTCITLSFCA